MLQLYCFWFCVHSHAEQARQGTVCSSCVTCVFMIMSLQKRAPSQERYASSPNEFAYNNSHLQKSNVFSFQCRGQQIRVTNESSLNSSQDQFTAIRSIVSDVLSSEETSSSSLRLPQDPATLRRTLVDFAKYITELEKVLIPSQVPEYVDSSVGFSSGRFFGRSSNSVLLNVAIDLKKGQDTGFDTTQLHHMRPEFWMPNPVSAL